MAILGESEEKKPDSTRTHVNDSARIEALRERLYSRGNPSEAFSRHDLERTAHTTKEVSDVEIPPALPPDISPLPHLYTPPPMPLTSSRSSFRSTFALVGIIFFIGALAVSSAFLFLGNDATSGNNISIDVSGPLTVAGGETMNLQIAIGNQNTLPIESATLIITYPRGAQSTTDAGKELFTERQELNRIGNGEVVNVPVQLLMYGEQDEEKEVKVLVEYRVQGSNSIFFKEALPFTFKISSSPIIINFNGVERTPSGQETELEVVIQSNTKEPLTNLLVRATYPRGFDFTASVPETASGQDTWKIKSLKPGESQVIKIRGLVSGNDGEENTFEIEVGVANERDALSLASTLSTGKMNIIIERPFLDVKVLVNGKDTETVVIDPTGIANVSVQFKNALDTVVYDGVVYVELEGNALDEIDVDAQNGYYDSIKNTVKWDSIDSPQFRELAPGESHSVTFSVDPRDDIKATPEIRFRVTIQGNRVSEGRVPEQVVGTVARIIKIASITKLSTSALYSEGPFRNTGPIPPVAEKTTQYTYLLSLKNGTNPITGAEVSAVMPQYMTWLDLVSEDDDVIYNPSTRSIKWNVGEMAAGAYEEVWIQVSFLPSLSLVGETPTILETQRFRATDRFTGTVIRSDAPALTTRLQNDPDPKALNGTVQER